MGFYTTSKTISQSLFLFFLGEGGPRGNEHNLYEYATLLTIYIMGFSDSVYLIKERINMTKETLRKTDNTITHLDSMKAVKVAFDLSESNQDSINKIMQEVDGNVNNINLLAKRIAKLEESIDILFELIKGQEKNIQRLESYERSKSN